jgi:hypothetical protein
METDLRSRRTSARHHLRPRREGGRGCPGRRVQDERGHAAPSDNSTKRRVKLSGRSLVAFIDLPLVEIVLAGVLAAAIVLALVIWFNR